MSIYLYLENESRYTLFVSQEILCDMIKYNEKIYNGLGGGGNILSSLPKEESDYTLVGRVGSLIYDNYPQSDLQSNIAGSLNSDVYYDYQNDIIYIKTVVGDYVSSYHECISTQ